MSLDLEVDAIAGVLVVTPHGALDGRQLEPLRDCLEKAVAGGRPVVLDLLAADEIGRGGLNLLRDVHKRLGTRFRLVVERGTPVHRTLKDAALAHVLALHPTRPIALAAATTRPLNSD